MLKKENINIKEGSKKLSGNNDWEGNKYKQVTEEGNKFLKLKEGKI